MNKLNTVIELPWTMSILFRTVHSTGTLMKLVSANSTSLLEVSVDLKIIFSETLWLFKREISKYQVHSENKVLLQFKI